MKIDFAKRRRVMERARLLVCAAGGVWLCSCISSCYADGSTIRPSLPACTTFNRGAGRGESLFVTLRLQSGEDLLFVVDTGCPGITLDNSLEPKLGKRIGTKTIQYGWLGKATVGIYTMPSLYLGDTQLRTGERVRTDDLSKFHLSRQFKGILGMDCLHYYCLQLDFAADKMHFLDPDRPGSEDLGKAFPLHISRRGIATHGTLAGVTEADSVVDTAEYWDGALEPKLFHRMLQECEAASTHRWIDSNGTPRLAARFTKGAFDNETYPDLLLSENHPGGVNLIGLRFLARHLVTLNFPKRTMYLKRTSIGPLSPLPKTNSPLSELK